MAIYSESGYLEIPLRASETVGASSYSAIEVFGYGVRVFFEDGRRVRIGYSEEDRTRFYALPGDVRAKIHRFGCRLSKSLMERPRSIGF